MSGVVAVVPAKDRADSVGDTVAALRPLVDEVVVVDDGSRDSTADAAVGARVVRLAQNVGKGGAVSAGVLAAPDADVYLLIDADVAGTAALADALLAPVLAGRADMTIGVLPAAGRRGGFGRVRALAAAGIRRACGFSARAPLSGQRAVRGDLLRSLLPLADRFGLEVGLTVDAVRAGAVVEEVDVAMDHRHTGRSVSGFRHRARQGADVVRALWPRLTTAAQRMTGIVVVFALLAALALWLGSREEPASVAASARPSKVLLVGAPVLDWDHPAPAMAAMNVRTRSDIPSAEEGYATLGAGERVDLDGRPVPNRLGDALRAAGKRAVVVGEPAAQAAFGASAPTAASVDEALATADVVLVDQGAPVDVRRADTLVLTFAVRPPTEEWRLVPLTASGPGVHAGYLHSQSTRRVGVVTLTDVAPTVLDALGVAVPPGMVGQPLRYRPGDVSAAYLRELDRDAAFRERLWLPVNVGFITIQVLAYALAILGRRHRMLRWVVLGVAAWPLATFLFRAVPDGAALGNAGVAVMVALDAAVVWLALRARRHRLAPLAWIGGATVALVLVDVWTGARLQTSSLFGYSLHTAGRFTGLGNAAFAVLTTAAVLAVCLHVHHAPRHREALVTAGCVFGLVALTDGAPTLGADVGGILTMVPVFGLALVALAGRRLSARSVGVAGAATVVVLGLVAWLDYLRDTPTHLGRLVADVREQGVGVFWRTVERRTSASLRTYRSPWTWFVPVGTVYLLGKLVVLRAYQGWLPRGSALRIAAVAILAVGVLGNVVNDSGVAVTAVMFVYLGPLLVEAAS
ncbi:MAG TPA: glycosyltransferase [Acidimicrobiales bacterium]|nr:glycosyltransferase [Acidimicrobiales bacterium]